MLAEQISAAKDRVVFVAPGVSETIATALVKAQEHSRSVTVILDPDEEVCRIGYGDVNGLEYLMRRGGRIELRKHSGVRLGLLMAESVVTIWSPTPRAVDGDRKPNEPNAVVIDGGIVEASNVGDAVQTETLQQAMVEMTHSGGDAVARSTLNLAEQIARRLDDEHVGEQPIRPDELQELVKELKRNPPAPFDLARKVRVFSTKFQFVEAESQGAEWTGRRIKLSGLLLNSDLPDSLQDLLETQIRPYKTRGDIPIEVPCIVMGQIAYNEHREKIRVPMTQRDMEGLWKEIRDRYLFRVPGFGALVRKRELAAFRAEIEAFECVLQDWVAQFRHLVNQDEDDLVSDIVNLIQGRIEQSGRKEDFHNFDLTREVRSGLGRMRVIEPRVRIVIKDVSWESSRDLEFTSALQEALPAEELRGWFDEFVAAQERR